MSYNISPTKSCRTIRSIHPIDAGQTDIGTTDRMTDPPVQVGSVESVDPVLRLVGVPVCGRESKM
jgi:hypothetical protein